MVADLGGGKNYSDDFDSLAAARLYSHAMAFGRVKLVLEAAGNQFRPDRALQLLPALEAEYGIVPERDATIGERRRELAAAMRIARGASQVNVDFVLGELLGDDFISYTPIPYDDAVVTTATPEDEGIYCLPGTQRSVFRLLDSVTFVGTPVTVAYEAVVGAKEELEVGEKFAVDAGDPGRVEIVEVTAIGDGTFTATFESPHNSGVLFATGRFPNLAGTKRHNVVKLTEDGAASARIQRRTNNAVRRLLRGVSTWAVTDSDDAFTVGEGLLGLTLIGEDDLPEPEIEGMVLHLDMADVSSYSVSPGTPDKVSEAINKATFNLSDTFTGGGNEPEYEANGMNGLPCMRGNGTNMRLISTEAEILTAFGGVDHPFTAVWVVEALSPDALAFFGGAANSGSANGVVAFGTTATGSGRYAAARIEDGGTPAFVAGSVDIVSDPALLVYVFDGFTLSLYVNGSETAHSSGSFFFEDPTTPNRFGLFCRAGNSPDGFISARISEVRVYDNAISAADRAVLSEVLLSKWNF
jgi:hypothetical protein